ncbi:MAG: hypoxanthine-guanine phosphoribosyltransferase, partial [Pseudomonadota bacterium]|nr:hypoxanthine-guanine phosphoribosyltransferase [Pseudomonadota bacterium]
MIPDGSDLVFDAEEIDSAVVRIAHQLNSDCAGGVWLLLAVMNGAVVFAADLMRRLTFAHELDSVRVSRYHGETT